MEEDYALGEETSREPSVCPPRCTVYPLECYNFNAKDAQPEEDSSVAARLQRLAYEYELTGMRTTVEIVLVVHEHGHPHVLLLQMGNTFFKLPGRSLTAEESITDAIKSCLDEQLAPDGISYEWQIGELLAKWWRPNFESYTYPYKPAHIKFPKECKQLYLVSLPPSITLSIPKNLKLLAVPLFELYDNSACYGPQLSALPILLSRVEFEMSDLEAPEPEEVGEEHAA